MEDDLEVSAMVYALSCPSQEPILLHHWEQRAGELKLPCLSLPSWVTLHLLCLGGPAVTGDGTTLWGAPV